MFLVRDGQIHIKAPKQECMHIQSGICVVSRLLFNGENAYD